MKKKISKDTLINRDVLENFSNDELAELAMVAEETIRQSKTKVKYAPNKVQKRFHNSHAFIRALFSGNGVGKTTACINEAIWTATGTHPYRETARIPNTTIIVLDDPGKADHVYIAQLKKKKWYDVSKLVLEKHGRSYTTEVKFPNGSNWIFMTHEMSEEKWESIECAGVIFDEPPPRFIYIALMRGQREKDMKPWIAFAGTPRGKNAPWMYRDIYKPWKFNQDSDIECFHGTTYDNIENLDPDTITRWKKRFSEQELKTRLSGEFEFLSGRIFSEFYKDIHVEPPFTWPYGWPVILAIDPHLRKNHVAVLLGIDPDKEVHVICELETSLAGSKAAEFFINACEQYPIKFGICDNFGSMPHTGGVENGKPKSFIEVFNDTARRMGAKFRIRATTKAEKSDDEWIEDMKQWLRVEPDSTGVERPFFHIFDTCIKSIDNFETYIWDEHKGAMADGKDVKEKPLGTNCDQLMCIKYGLATKPDKMGIDKIYRKSAGRLGGAREYESNGIPWTKD